MTTMEYSQPNLYSLEDLSVSQTIQRVFKIVSSQCLTFFQLAISVVLPFIVVCLGGAYTFWSILAVGLSKISKDQNDQNWEDYQAVLLESFVGLSLVVVMSVVLSVVVTIVGKAAMVRATAELYAHHRMPDASVALQKGLWQFCELFLAGILLAIIMLFVMSLPILLTLHDMALLGIFLSIVAPFVAMYLSIRLSLVYPAIVIEESCTATGGLKRSWELTEGAFCDIWCAKSCFGALFGLVVYFAIKIFTISAEHANEKAAIAMVVFTLSLPNFFFTPCSTV